VLYERKAKGQTSNWCIRSQSRPRTRVNSPLYLSPATRRCQRLPSSPSLSPWGGGGGRKIPSDSPRTRARAEFVKTDNAIIAGIAIKVHASEIQRAGKLSRSRSTDKPTPREVSGVVKLRGNSLRAISRWYVIKKERERERERISITNGVRADPRFAAEIRARASQSRTRDPAKFRSSKAANNARE